MMEYEKTIEEKIEDFTVACKEAGLKVTHQRIEIFKTLAETKEHPDVDTIYNRVKQKVPTISLDTVYRTLRTLVQHGLVTLLQVSPERMRFDANTAPHYHFIDDESGKVVDLEIDPIELNIPDEISNYGEISSITVEFRGKLHNAG